MDQRRLTPALASVLRSITCRCERLWLTFSRGSLHLPLTAEHSAEQAFSHADPPSTLSQCSRMLSALATNSRLSLQERRLLGRHFAGRNFRNWPVCDLQSQAISK